MDTIAAPPQTPAPSPLQSPAQVEAPGTESVLKTASNAVSVAGCAVAVFAVGAFFGAAWPAAVAACGISVMGIGVAFFMLKRS
jgi:hypothetical protein